ncbi:MAG: YfhO family protein [Agathobacter sp.]|nr:YfhO family protein [Agathobacter sp.]
MKVLLKKNWIWSALAFGIPFFASVIICAAAGVYPFGDRCVLHVDMYHQYCPFFMEFREKLATGGSLLYTWNLGLGSDFLAHYAYYLASPLNWLLVLCPKMYVIEFMTLTIWTKIGLSGLFFFWFLKERFTLIDKEGKYIKSTSIPALVFATAYAFSGFVAAYYWDVMWMDCVALTPLVVIGLERLVRQNKPALYYISLSVAILSNFYMGYILCIFLVLYYGILFLEQKEGRIRGMLSFAWYSLLAGGTGAILMIPEALVLGNSASADSGWPEQVEWYFGFMEELSRVCVIANPYTGNNHWPNLYSGVFAVVLLVLYVCNHRVKWSEKIPRLLVVGFLFISFANNYLDCFWHGFRFPNSLPGRQSFLFTFVLLMIGFDTYCKRKGNRISHIIVTMALCIGVLIVSARKTPEDITEPIAFWLTGIFVVAYGLCFMVYRMGTKQMKLLMKGFAFGLAMGEILINMGMTGFYTLNRTAYLSKHEDYEVLLELAEKDAVSDALEGGVTFYRVEDTERKTKNDDSLYGYASGTIFSSVLNIDASHFYQKVYMEGGKNFYCYNGATPVISSMLSVKYMLNDNDQGENALREIIGSSNGYYLYENKYCLPLGFMMEEEAIENWDMEEGRSIAHINNLAYELGATRPMLENMQVESVVSNGMTTFTAPEDGIYYGYYDKCSSDSLTMSINGGAETRFGKTTHRYLLEFGECTAGDEVCITNGKGELITFYVYKLNMDALDTAYETLSQQTMVTEEFTDTYVKGTIDVKEAGRLVLSVTDESGWTLYVDGKETPMQDFKETFISVHLEEGTHTIELKYMSPGLGIGAAITGGCVGLFVVTQVIRRMLSTRKAKQDEIDVAV